MIWLNTLIFNVAHFKYSFGFSFKENLLWRSVDLLDDQSLQVNLLMGLLLPLEGILVPVFLAGKWAGVEQIVDHRGVSVPSHPGFLSNHKHFKSIWESDFLLIRFWLITYDPKDLLDAIWSSYGCLIFYFDMNKATILPLGSKVVSSVVARNRRGPPTTHELQVCQVKLFTFNKVLQKRGKFSK